jgi:hypothetical protein
MNYREILNDQRCVVRISYKPIPSPLVTRSWQGHHERIVQVSRALFKQHCLIDAPGQNHDRGVVRSEYDVKAPIIGLNGTVTVESPS